MLSLCGLNSAYICAEISEKMDIIIIMTRVRLLFLVWRGLRDFYDAAATIMSKLPWSVRSRCRCRQHVNIIIVIIIIECPQTAQTFLLHFTLFKFIAE